MVFSFNAILMSLLLVINIELECIYTGACGYILYLSADVVSLSLLLYKYIFF